MLNYYPRVSPKDPVGVDVGDTSIVVLEANLNRRYAVFTNDSDTVIYLAFADTAVAHKGVRLNPNGGSYELAPLKNFYDGVVSAVTASGTGKRLCIQEG